VQLSDVERWRNYASPLITSDIIYDSGHNLGR